MLYYYIIVQERNDGMNEAFYCSGALNSINALFLEVSEKRKEYIPSVLKKMHETGGLWDSNILSKLIDYSGNKSGNYIMQIVDEHYNTKRLVNHTGVVRKAREEEKRSSRIPEFDVFNITPDELVFICYFVRIMIPDSEWIWERRE